MRLTKNNEDMMKLRYLAMLLEHFYYAIYLSVHISSTLSLYILSLVAWTFCKALLYTMLLLN